MLFVNQRVKIRNGLTLLRDELIDVLRRILGRKEIVKPLTASLRVLADFHERAKDLLVGIHSKDFSLSLPKETLTFLT